MMLRVELSGMKLLPLGVKVLKFVSVISPLDSPVPIIKVPGRV